MIEGYCVPGITSDHKASTWRRASLDRYLKRKNLAIAEAMQIKRISRELVNC